MALFCHMVKIFSVTAVIPCCEEAEWRWKQKLWPTEAWKYFNQWKIFALEIKNDLGFQVLWLSCGH